VPSALNDSAHPYPGVTAGSTRYRPFEPENQQLPRRRQTRRERQRPEGAIWEVNLADLLKIDGDIIELPAAASRVLSRRILLISSSKFSEAW
jgi:hypothetical protein